MGMILSYAFAHIIESVILWMSMSQMYEHRYKQWITGLMIMLGHVVMFTFFLRGNIYFVTIVNIAVYIILISVLYQVNIKVTTFWAILYIAMMALSELIVFYCIQYLFGVKDIKNEKTVIILVVICLCKILYFIIVEGLVWILNKNSKSKNLRYDDISFLLLMMVLVSSIIVFISFYMIGMRWELDTRETIWMEVSMITLVFNDVIVLLVNIINTNKNEENQRIKVQLEKERADAEYYKLENEKNESFEIFRHDIKNHLNAILDMEESSKVKNYVKNIMKEYSIGFKTTFSNSSVLNGLLSQYIKKCEDRNISITIDIRSDTVENMIPTDVVSLFGNIMSNAFEAAEKCEEKSYIELVVKRNKNMIVIKECNSCINKPVKYNGNYVTSKQDNENRHGYGMKSIYRIVKKYNGTHVEKYDEKNHEFNIAILLLVNYKEL